MGIGDAVWCRSKCMEMHKLTFCHGSVNEAWHDGVDPDAKVAVLLGERGGEA